MSTPRTRRWVQLLAQVLASVVGCSGLTGCLGDLASDAALERHLAELSDAQDAQAPDDTGAGATEDAASDALGVDDAGDACVADACNDAACSPATGACAVAPKPDGVGCDADGDPCTVADGWATWTPTSPRSRPPRPGSCVSTPPAR